MNFIVLGTLISEKTRKTFDDMGARSEPGDLVQRNILDELCVKKNNNVFLLSSPRIQGYPRCKVKIVNTETFEYKNVKCKCVGFLNFGYFGLLNREHNFVEECKKWANDFQSNDLCIIVYSLNSAFLKGATQIKKIIPNSKICAIVPDLPNYMSNYKWPLSVIKKSNIKRIEKLRKNVDFYCLYSAQMASKLQLTDNYLIVDGFAKKEKINLKRNAPKHKTKVCLYAGDLSPQYGIQMMIDAFKELDLDCELHIYGNEKMILNYSLNDRVKFMGRVSSDVAFQKMVGADLLINPRPSSLELTAYSFPSKTLEYMSSGTPCVMCKLPAIPKDYYEHIFLFEYESSEGFKRTIEHIFQKTDEELNTFGYHAAKFIFDKKTADVYIDSMISMFNKICQKT